MGVWRTEGQTRSFRQPFIASDKKRKNQRRMASEIKATVINENHPCEWTDMWIWNAEISRSENWLWVTFIRIST